MSEKIDYKNKTKEELVKEIESLQKTIKEANDEVEIQTWGLKKTNEAIKLLYKELDSKNKELQKLDKLKSDFVSTVSHELRTPLTITKEGISLILDEITGKINDQQRRYLNIARDNIDRLSRLINDLLDMSKIEAGKIELKKSLVEITNFVKETCARWELEFKKKKQNFTLLKPGSKIFIYLDQDKIERVLNNLISNAVKYSCGGCNIQVELKDEKDFVEISVTDNGKGIAKEDLPKVFSKFYQFGRTEGPGEKGTGLGLAITKELVEMHQGTIEVDSDLGKGSKFTFTLPKMDYEIIFKEYINKGIKDAEEKKASLSLIVARIPQFNKIQEKLGYEGAHGFLCDIEKAINASLRRKADTVIRDTGELIIILFDTAKENVYTVKARIQNAVMDHARNMKDDILRNITVIFGSATYPDDAKNDDGLLDKARE